MSLYDESLSGMPGPTMAELNAKRNTEANLRNVRDWETERQSRINGYAAVLTYLDTALEAVPVYDASSSQFAGEIAHTIRNARGRMRAIFDEPNPFVVPQPNADAIRVREFVGARETRIDPDDGNSYVLEKVIRHDSSRTEPEVSITDIFGGHHRFLAADVWASWKLAER